MKKSNVIPRDNESVFTLPELFFSTTDKKGLIKSGNEIFVRVSGFTPEEIIGEPHNTVRHPEMPRCVFKTLWDAIAANKPLVAYVKNMSKDGSYYWVVALALPLEDGYLSIRFKPTSAIFDTVANLYRDLKAKEDSFGSQWKEGMLAAEEMLQQTLNSLGFEDYEAFMRVVLQQELKSRDEKLNSPASDRYRFYLVNNSANQGAASTISTVNFIGAQCSGLYDRLDTLFRQLDSFVSLNEQLEKRARHVLELMQGFRFVSLNASVRSATLGTEGGSLSVIADQMRDSSSGVSEAIKAIESRVEAVSHILRRTSFSIAAARLQLEMVMQFCEGMVSYYRQTGKCDSGASVRPMLQDLQSALTAMFTSALESLHDIRVELDSLDSHSHTLYKMVMTLRFTQLSGLIEACRLSEEKSFGVIFEEVREQLDKATEELKELGSVTRGLHFLVADTPALDQMFRATVAESEDAILSL